MSRFGDPTRKEEGSWAPRALTGSAAATLLLSHRNDAEGKGKPKSPKPKAKQEESSTHNHGQTSSKAGPGPTLHFKMNVHKA